MLKAKVAKGLELLNIGNFKKNKKRTLTWQKTRAMISVCHHILSKVAGQIPRKKTL
jgi:hypothetical protein